MPPSYLPPVCVSYHPQVENNVGCGEDTIIISVQSVELSPQAENPLNRMVINEELHRKHVARMEVPGSVYEDRQLQLDITGFSVRAGKLNSICYNNYESMSWTHCQYWRNSPSAARVLVD